MAWVLLAVAGLTETWNHSVYDNGFRIYGHARSGEGLLIGCYGPSQGGLDVVAAEAHEDAHIPQGHLQINIDPKLIPVGNAMVRSDVVLWLDGTGYGLPQTIWNELDWVWQVNISMQDGLFQAMRRAKTLILAGGQTPWQLATDGMGTALDQAVATCNAAWAEGAIAAPSALMGRALQDIRTGCSGPFTSQAGAVREVLFDHDTQADVIVDWSKISCNAGPSRPFCGASHCSVRIFLSTRGGAFEDLLAQAVQRIDLSNGRVGLGVVARQTGCPPDSLGCDRIWYWTGAGIDQLP